MYSINKKYLKPLQGSSLYYPCAGSDIEAPVLTFSPYITDFWFVDINYLNLDLGHINFPEFKYLKTEFEGPIKTEFKTDERVDGRARRDLDPGIRTDYYEFNGRTIKVNRRRGFGCLGLFGPTELPINMKKLGVFFYRGDSFEGGTRKRWMSTGPSYLFPGHRVSLLSGVIHKLCNYGLLVTDGSNNGGTNNKKDKQYYQLFRFNWSDISCKEAVKKANNFKDENNYKFDCIGHVGKKYGPTLVWRITKS